MGDNEDLSVDQGDCQSSGSAEIGDPQQQIPQITLTKKAHVCRRGANGEHAFRD